jgi:hypothetical protein
MIFLVGKCLNRLLLKEGKGEMIGVVIGGMIDVMIGEMIDVMIATRGRNVKEEMNINIDKNIIQIK